MVGRVVEGEADFVTSRASALSPGAVLFVAALGHISLFPRVADLDGFYHIGHAAAYLEGSLFDTSLPWATWSVIGARGGDLWWGFHVVLTPFAALGDVAVAMRLAGLVLTLVLGGTVFWVLRRHGVTGAAWWAALFLVAVPNIFFRHLMVRPHVLSLAASIALLSVLVRGRWWQAGLLSAAISWLHLSLFWVAPGLVVAYAITRIPVTVAVDAKEPDVGVPLRHALPAVFAGTLAGWLLRPAPLDTAWLLNVQLFHLFTQKATGQPIAFAGELLPIGIAELLRTTWLFSAAWVLGLIATAYALARGLVSGLGQERGTFLISAILVSGAFLGLSLLSARRAMEQYVAFGFLVLPFVWCFASDAEHRRRMRPLVVVLLVAHLAWGARRHMLNVDQVAFPADALGEAAAFLAANSEPGDVVFHARWDNFGPLFAHNRTNAYLGGMDPIFQYAYDARSYWQYFYLSADVNVEWTCDAFPCSSGIATDSHEVIREHFGARWVLVEPRRNPRLTLHLMDDPRFELALETQREAVFAVLADPEAVTDDSRRGGG